MRNTPDIIHEGFLKDIRMAFIRHRVTGTVMKSLTGRLADLGNLNGIIHTAAGNPGLQNFLDGLNNDIVRDQGMAGLFARIGKELADKPKRKLIENLIFNWGYRGLNARKAFLSYDSWVPSFLVLSPSMQCNLHCKGCYSGLYEKEGVLREDEIEMILNEARNLGIFFIVISGGEPFIMSETWMKLFHKFSDIYFLVYTNGTLLDEKTVSELAKLGNIAPAISLEGYEKETDERRGRGIYHQVLHAMDLLKSHGLMFGMSITYTKYNIETVTSPSFIEEFIDRGCIFAWYFMFMPVGKDPILDLVPTPGQRLECGNRIMKMRKREPLFMADFWNDGPAIAGCLAGGRNYLHILNSGRIEPCVFAHFGKDNIRDTSLFEAVNSPFFRAIRDRFPYNENANLKRPCMIIDNPEVLREVVREHLVPAGHAHSEDLISNPEVSSWIDSYAAEFKKLIDPIWNGMIEDPNNRWYRNKEEYGNLFWFQKQLALRRAEERSSKHQVGAGSLHKGP